MAYSVNNDTSGFQQTDKVMSRTTTTNFQTRVPEVDLRTQIYEDGGRNSTAAFDRSSHIDMSINKGQNNDFGRTTEVHRTTTVNREFVETPQPVKAQSHSIRRDRDIHIK